MVGQQELQQQQDITVAAAFNASAGRPMGTTVSYGWLQQVTAGYNKLQQVTAK